MTHDMQQVHARMAHRSRNEARGGRHMMTEATKPISDGGGRRELAGPGESSVEKAQRSCDAGFLPSATKCAALSPDRGDTDTNITGPPSDFIHRQHELKTPVHPEAYILAVRDACKSRKVPFSLRQDLQQTVLLVVCSDVDWRFVQGEGVMR
jgi:hypothetical protein